MKLIFLCKNIHYMRIKQFDKVTVEFQNFPLFMKVMCVSNWATWAYVEIILISYTHFQKVRPHLTFEQSLYCRNDDCNYVLWVLCLCCDVNTTYTLDWSFSIWRWNLGAFWNYIISFIALIIFNINPWTY